MFDEYEEQEKMVVDGWHDKLTTLIDKEWSLWWFHAGGRHVLKAQLLCHPPER